MKDISKNYLTIQGWMVQDLKLNSNSLLTFALIYGFCQDTQSEFTGSINYICNWLNCSRPTVSKALNELIELDVIIKTEKIINSVQFNTYKINLDVVNNLCRGSKETLQGVVKKLDGGSKETLHNNNKYTNNKYIYKNTENNISENQLKIFNDIKNNNTDLKKEFEEQEKTLNIDSEYYKKVIELWNKHIFKFTDRKVGLTSLQPIDKQNLKNINLPISEISKGMFILFNQKDIIASCLITPKHFFYDFNKYYVAGLEYEKTKKITQIYQSKNN